MTLGAGWFGPGWTLASDRQDFGDGVARPYAATHRRSGRRHPLDDAADADRGVSPSTQLST